MTGKEIDLPNLTNLDVVDAKQLVRSAVRARRSKMSKAEIDRYGELFAQRIMEFAAHTTTVALYVSVNEEPATYRALELLQDNDRGILLPKLGPGLARMWAWYEGIDRLIEDAPGRPPSPDSEPLGSDAIEQVGAVIVPALAVDHRGRRVGQGGGWYDRMLKQDVSGAATGALIYPWELVSVDLPYDEMDRGVQAAILPEEIISL